MIEIEYDENVYSYEPANMENRISTLKIGKLIHGLMTVDRVLYGEEADSEYGRICARRCER